jgi:hypothetical protein
MDKLESILTEVYNQKNSVVYFPVRHHSPACSYHIKSAVAEYKPDCVLIEAPCDTDVLIPCLLNSKPPVSIYYSYSDESGKHACYYPLLDFSPELTAVREAREKNIPVHFIDLPYGNIIRQKRENADETENETTGSDEYFYDYFLQRSNYTKLICERENCRDYNELWEKLFELPAPKLSAEEFIMNLTSMCYYSRVDYPEELLKQEHNQIRESFMAENIIKHSQKYKRILVVTGGFHTWGLMELVKSGNPQKIKPIKGEAYLIPYSFKESDRLSGYESGMPYPGFYQSLHEMLGGCENENFARRTVLEYIAKLAKSLRRNRESISLSEEIAAYSLCLGLANLRDKPDVGVYEFFDGVRSAFIKGELNLSASLILTQAIELLRGSKVGKVGEDAPMPPIVFDFFKIAKSYRMDIVSTQKKSVTLDIVSNAQHRNKSIFLHRLQFLQNPYARKTYGPDYEGRRNTKLIREKWVLAFSGKVTSALIEKSHLGGTVAEACEILLSDLIKDNCNCSAEAADLLIRAGVMGLFAHTERLLQIVTNLINSDHSFASLTECVKSLAFLQDIRHVLRIEKDEQIRTAKIHALNRVIPMLCSLSASDEKEDYKLAEAVKTLHRAAFNEPALDMDYFNLSLTDLFRSKQIPPAVDGAVTGLLYNSPDVDFDINNALKRANSYFTATGDILSLSGRFLRGLFLTAKDILFYDSGFLHGLNNAIKRLSYDDFLKVLPDLRLAFTSFTPLETNTISKNVFDILGLLKTKSLTEFPVISENEYKIIRAIDEKVMRLI